MDTSILHSRIKEYKEKAKNPTSKEMILLFETWFLSIENYLADVEIDNFELNKRIEKLYGTINFLFDIIIITGNADKLIINPEDKYMIEAISLLLKSKDRKNHNSITAISALLSFYPDTKFSSLKQLKDHATGE